MSSRFDILDTPLPGLKVIQRKPIRDSRGYLDRVFCSQEMDALIPNKSIAQTNHTLTVKRGAVRGMHYQQPPHAEIKFVSCLRGEVFDVAVDLRQGSQTFLRWHAEVLNPQSHRTLLVPEGFAHGFQALTDDCELLYFTTAAYAPEAERGLNVRDPMLAVVWPRPIAEMSPRDAAHPMLTADFRGVPI
jgi:dTDP-4-dehydrorhamnose 3,5-epimerase